MSVFLDFAIQEKLKNFSFSVIYKSNLYKESSFPKYPELIRVIPMFEASSTSKIKRNIDWKIITSIGSFFFQTVLDDMQLFDDS